MGDLAYKGHCLNCGKPVEGQSECDYCADGNGKYGCPECGEKFKAFTPLSHCWQHEDDIDDLREICACLQYEVGALKKKKAELIRDFDKIHSMVRELQGIVVKGWPKNA